MKTGTPGIELTRLFSPLYASESPEEHQERKALLQTLLLAMIATGCIGVVAHQVSLTGQHIFVLTPASVLAGIGLCFFIIPLLLNRAGKTDIAAWISIVIATAMIAIVTVPVGDDPGLLSLSVYYVVPVMIAAVLLPLIWAVVIAGVCGLYLVLVPFVFGDSSLLVAATDYAMFILIVGSLALFVAYRRARFELARREVLVANEQKYRFLAENMTDVLFIQGLSMEFLYVSPSVKALSGYSEDELLCMEMRQVMTPESFERAIILFNDSYKKAVSGNAEPPLMEFEYVRKDGLKFWGELRVKFLRNAGGEIVGSQGVLRDITARRQAEQEHRRLQDELRQADKMRAVGQLAGGIAHDFNNQLTGVMACAEILRTALSDRPDLRDMADLIVKSAERSSQLTGNLLSFSRRGSIQATPVNLHELISEIVKVLEHSIDKRIKITQRLSAEMPVAIGDPSQLQNTLLNIAINARDAMLDGGTMTFESSMVTLDDEFCSRSEFGVVAGRYLKIDISDTGMGMDEQTKRRIFEPFFTTKEPGKGTGMGLATVHGTMYSHKGAVDVTSSPGKGTKLSLFLPATAEELIAVAARMSQPLPVPRGRTILLADDEELVRVAAGRLLEEAGHTVQYASNGQEAVDMYRQNHSIIDLVILDMVMPEMNGPETIAFLRAVNPVVKVLIISGYAIDSETRRLTGETGASFLQKPFSAEALQEKVSEVIRRRVR